jgi:hypothetical protein
MDEVWIGFIGLMKIYHRATGQCLAEEVAVANTFFKRLRGLMFRRSRLAPAEALWLRPCNGVHTFWMLFAIDVIFLDQQLQIVKLVENMRPFRVTSPHLDARSVLEMSAHTISRASLKIGDRLEVER